MSLAFSLSLMAAAVAATMTLAGVLIGYGLVCYLEGLLR